MKIIKKRDGKKYKEWREKVFERDKFTCQQCKLTDIKLHPHHIIGWDEDKTLRLDVNNGLTLCTSCHNKLHHIGREPWNKGISPTKEQREKMSLAKIGKPSPRKGVKVGTCWNKGKKTGVGGPKGQKFTAEHCDKLSKLKLGKKSWNKGLTGEKSHTFGKKMPHKGKTWIIDSYTGKRKWID